MNSIRSQPIRVVLSKIGLDGHDRGIKIVARALRDCGMEVIYTGLWQSPQAAVRAVEEEDADCLGVSLLSGAHMTLVPVLFEAMRQRRLDHVTVLVGGIIPEQDVPRLLEMGVARVFGPGAPLEEIADVVRRSAGRRRQVGARCAAAVGSAREPGGTSAAGAGESAAGLDELVAGLQQSDRRALARLISLLESGSLGPEERQRLPGGAANRGGKRLGSGTAVVGITGSAGAGKSTLIAALVEHLRGMGRSVAVLACDPQSPVTGGALLGDRIRMRFSPEDEGVYFRSLSTRGAPGGMAEAVNDAVPLLEAFGFDCVLIETIGVGQADVAVRGVCDALVLLVTPGTGDEVQWQKAGVIEVADIVLVNKSDLAGSAELAAQLRHVLSMGTPVRPQQVLTCTASRGEGIAALWQALAGVSARV